MITWPRTARFIHTTMEVHLVGPQSAEKDYRRLRGVVNQRISEALDNISRSVPALLVTIMKINVSRPGTPVGLAGCKH